MEIQLGTNKITLPQKNPQSGRLRCQALEKNSPQTKLSQLVVMISCFFIGGGGGGGGGGRNPES